MKRLSFLLFLCLIGFALPHPTFSQSDPLLAQARAQGSVRVIVKLAQTDPQVFSAARADLLDSLAGALVNTASLNWAIPYAALTVDESALAALRASPLVAGVYEDGLNYPELDSSIPVINADDVWARGYTGAGITVAVLDTGVDASHSFFGGRVVTEACFSSSVDSLCPNGEATMIGTGAASPSGCAGASGCSHGTHVSGIAVGSNASSSGVAHQANLIGIQVFSLAGTLTAYDSDIISGLNHVYSLRNSYNIAAANLSLSDGSYRTEPCDVDKAAIKAAIDLLRSYGIATVIASGNRGYMDAIPSPACISTAVSVGATDDLDNVASFSNRAPFLDLFAPGVSITSSIIGGGYGTSNGTSMAAPHVAGAMALLKQAAPSATVDQLQAALQSTGRYIAITNGAAPRIDVNAAIDVLTGVVPLNLLRNARFDAGNAFWSPWDAITWQVTDGVFEFYRNPGGRSAVIIQNTGALLPPGSPLELQIDLGNSGSTRKRAVILLHDADWSDFAVCNFWIPPGQPLQTYTMTTVTNQPWESAHLSVYASPADGTGWLRLDNAYLSGTPDAFNGVTTCTDPNAP
jgi:subtilisin family serine protease